MHRTICNKALGLCRGGAGLPQAYRMAMADANQAFCVTVADFLAGIPELELVTTVHTGMDAVQAVETYRPDILLLDMVLPDFDGLTVLQILRNRRLQPKVVVFSAYAVETQITQAMAMGAAYYIMKPFDFPTLVQRLLQLMEPLAATEKLRHAQRRQQVETEVERCIAELGVPRHFTGYHYLCEAVELVVEDHALLNRITKGLYPAIAAKFDTTPVKVERAIRHAIEITWARGNLDVINTLFAYSVDQNKGKPTNSSFVARLADHVRMQMRAR